MKIVIDARMIFLSGIGVYLQNLIPYLLGRYSVVLIGSSLEFKSFTWFNDVDIIETTVSIYSVREQVELFFKIPVCDIFWSPHYNIPLLPIKAKKRMVTIHDVFHLVIYDELSLRQKIYAKFVINQAVSRSDKILTVSNFSVNEIRKYTNTNKEIEVVYNAIDIEKFKKIDNTDELKKVKDKYLLPDEFLLFVGNVKPHKNLKNLLLAIKTININLVIIGKKDGFITADKDLSTILENDATLMEKIHFAGEIHHEELAIVYNLAKLFVNPSIYESFGIPAIEAQACGCPVLTSFVAGIPEVCIDSVVYFNPNDIYDIRDKIKVALNNTTLQNELTLKGFENIKRFSWEESAKKIINIIEDLK